MEHQNDTDWQDTLARRSKELDRITRRHQTAVWISETCVQVVETCYRLGGGSVVYDSSPLQRRMRDIHAASQHVSVNFRHYRTSGAMLLGHPAVHPLFAA
jgi:alkylation response protein AidB-like acyl-CoA dehydrogenase